MSFEPLFGVQRNKKYIFYYLCNRKHFDVFLAERITNQSIFAFTSRPLISLTTHDLFGHFAEAWNSWYVETANKKQGKCATSLMNI